MRSALRTGERIPAAIKASRLREWAWKVRGKRMEAVQLKPLILFSLLPVWVLAGLFQYLSRFTQRKHFRAWTAGWLFYALFLTLCARPTSESKMAPAFFTMAENWCLATAALLMLWGSFQFINVSARQRLIAMMVLFNLIWSYASAQQNIPAS